MSEEFPSGAAPAAARIVTGALEPPDSHRLAGMRWEYETAGISWHEMDDSWHRQLGRWLAEATLAGIAEPNAMVLATADEAGRPSTRTVLLKGNDEHGLVFYTNYGSHKGHELAANPYASVTFPWYPLHRQAHARGRVVPVPAAESDEYFASRPRGAQLGAWSSPQSTVIDSRDVLDDAFAGYERRWPEGAEVPRPEHWGGFRLVPEYVEFWQGRENRVHDRLRYRYDGRAWLRERLAP
ncbi:MAG: pyridoxamine 5'-phosphate oxidase [Actinocatenispora sp.]